MKSLKKIGPKEAWTRDLLGEYMAQRLKSELATAGAAIHPCIEVKPRVNIILEILNLKKNKNTREALFFFSNLQSAMDFVFLDEIKRCKDQTCSPQAQEHDGIN